MTGKLAGFFGAPHVKLILLAILAAACFGGGWAANGWRLGTSLAIIKLEAATGREQATAAALKTLTEDTKKIHEAATQSATSINGVNNKLAAIQKDMKNAKPPPLPAGCRPDPIRVQSLNATATAVDEAIARKPAR